MLTAWLGERAFKGGGEHNSAPQYRYGLVRFAQASYLFSVEPMLRVEWTYGALRVSASRPQTLAAATNSKDSAAYRPMTQYVFVFSALAEERVAFSVREDGANLPPARSGAPWLPGFRAVLTDASLGMFGVEPTSVSEALRLKGFFIGTPISVLNRKW